MEKPKEQKFKMKKASTMTDDQIKGLSSINTSPPVQIKKRKESSNILNANFFSTKLLDTKLESNKALIRFNLDDLKKNEIDDLNINTLNKEYKEYPECRGTTKSFNIIKSYAYNTYAGKEKTVNEDKISVKDQLKKPANSKNLTWPKISYFGIFDGHGGDNCSNFLKENMFTLITENKNFPIDIRASIIGAYEKAEELFKQKYQSSLTEVTEKSGSCALVLIIVDNKIYVANLGDSRAILSLNGGTKFKALSIDHKPNNPKEFERITKNGGKVYIDNDLIDDHDFSKTTVIKTLKEFDKYVDDKEVVFRAYPSDLAVTRTIGDYFAKIKELGGTPGIIGNIPEIFVLENNITNDFILMGCDGIFDDQSSAEIIETVWFTARKLAKEKDYDIHSLTKCMCDMVIKRAMEKGSGDNLSCIIIGFEGLEKFLSHKQAKDKVTSQMPKKKP